MTESRKHTIHLSAGKVTIEEAPEGHVVIATERLNVKHVSVFLNTVWADTDLAVSVNGQWLDGAYEAGQHKPKNGATA
jgi:hypothetical protein